MTTTKLSVIPVVVFACLVTSVASVLSVDEITIQQISANGTRSLRPFTVQGPWELRWDLKGQSLEVYLNHPDGEPVALLPMANQKRPGAGSSYYPKGGSFYLRIVAEGDWSVTVVQLNKERSAQPSSATPQIPTLTSLTISDFSWSRSRYGSLFLILTIENSSERDVKDFTISCSTYGQSGTEIGTVQNTFYEVIGAKSRREYEGVEIGPVHPQTFRVRCEATAGKK